MMCPDCAVPMVVVENDDYIFFQCPKCGKTDVEPNMDDEERRFKDIFDD